MDMSAKSSATFSTIPIYCRRKIHDGRTETQGGRKEGRCRPAQHTTDGILAHGAQAVPGEEERRGAKVMGNRKRGAAMTENEKKKNVFEILQEIRKKGAGDSGGNTKAEDGQDVPPVAQ